MSEKVNLNPNELKILESLNEIRSESEEGTCCGFDWIRQGTGLDRAAARRACRSLARKGFAEFHRGLMDDEGKVAGSGYCISVAGEAYLNPCDVCSGRITYEYEAKNGERVRECEQHYKKSPLHDKPKQKSLI